MAKKLKYDVKTWRVEDAIRDIINRNDELYFQDETYSYDEAYKTKSKVNELLERYKNEIVLVRKYSYENYCSIRGEIDYFDDKLTFREKALKKRKIRNGISYGIGVLLAPTGIPACIIGAKKIKEAIEELGD